MIKTTSKLCILTLFFLFICKDVHSQNYLFQTIPDSSTQMEIRYYRPDFTSPFTDLNILGGIYEARLNFPVSSKYNLDFNMPFINSSFEEFDASRGIGNISVGIQRKLKSEIKENSSFMLEIFVPVAKDGSDYLEFGLFTNFHDFAKFVKDALTIHLNYEHRYNIIQGFYLSGELGPSILFDVGENINETEIILKYGIAAMYDFDSFNIRAEFTGEGILTESEADDTFFQSLSVGAQLTQGDFKPGIFYNVFLDDNLSTSTNGVVGLIFSFTL